MIAKVKYCNCTDLVLPEGIVRALLIESFPQYKNINTEPCKHWEEVILPDISNLPNKDKE